MLASLLPGLRQLRAPLAAGYLWFVALWLIFSPSAEQADKWAGWKSLESLADDISPFGIGVAVSFVAYLLGALTEPVTRWLATWPLRRVKPVFGDRGVVELRALIAHRTRVLAHVSGFQNEARRRLRELPDFRAADPEEARIVEMMREASPERLVDRYATTLPQLASITKQLGFSDPVRAAESVYERVERVHALEGELISELPLVARRLAGANFELYSELDRQRAEADFRYAIYAPLAAVLLAFSVRSAWGLNAIIATSLAALVVVFSLTTQARLRDIQANETLIGLVRAGIVDFPLLEREYPRDDKPMPQGANR